MTEPLTPRIWVRQIQSLITEGTKEGLPLPTVLGAKNVTSSLDRRMDEMTESLTPRGLVRRIQTLTNNGTKED